MNDSNINQQLILVVDDDPVTRIYLEKALKEEGYDVLVAENGEKALEIYKQNNPDMVVLDVMMPLMNGFEVCKHIREQEKDINTPVLMLTGLDDVESIEKSFEHGATDFVVKPVNLPIFKQRIRYGLKMHKTDLELLNNQTHLSHIHTIAKSGYWEWDIANDDMKLSDEARNLFSINKEKPLNTFKDYIKYIHPDDRDDVEHAVIEALEQGTIYDIEYRMITPHNDLLVVHNRTEVITDASGKAVRMVGIIQDITEKHNAQKTLHHQANHDSLTDLPNRNLFKNYLEQMLLDMQNDKDREAVIFYVDIDRFSQINDTFGSETGDLFLVQMSDRLKTLVQTPEALTRMGADEFAVAFKETISTEDLKKRAKEFISVLSKPYHLDGNEISRMVSIGITISSQEKNSADELIRQASLAKQYAKEYGGDQFSLYTHNMGSDLNKTLVMENQLRKALDNSELKVFYQPIVHVKSGQISGMEALIRWEHPVRGIVPPIEFIPLAEETGLIIRIGQWILEESCRQTVEWHQKGFNNLVINVNISPMQFNQKNFFYMVTKVLKKTGLDPHYLELEITESCTMNNVNETISVLERLRKIGIKISIDDFGTGYSSLSYLNKMPLDTLKVDRSFIKEINSAGENGEIAKLIIAMAKTLDLNVISEGIETDEHLEFVEKHGSDEFQGFLVSPPVPADDFETLLFDLPQKKMINAIL
jgi:diguanylate cyclase (GGDEF)-like protein/PAS domain S-box-containing protein